MPNKFYVTTSIAYVNAAPHIGFALELLQADVLSRYHAVRGDVTYYLTGTDEHGAKIVRSAESAKMSPKDFTEKNSELFKKLSKELNVINDDFIRTSDQERHWPTAQKIWQQLAEKEDLYKKNYTGLYCVGHEAFMKKSDLDEDGICPLHKTKPEKIEEENWFFKLSKYRKKIKKKIEADELRILPVSRKNEILNLLDEAEDVSFSRPSKDISWGVPVPGDDSQTMYVWCDALTNYISALGYAQGDDKFYKYWPADVHLVGKDIIRFHAMIWPAMLMSVGLALPKSIYVHGFITVEGEKMSKSLGNVIDPFKLVEKYGVDPVRYFLLREIPSTQDGDFSYKKLEDRYNGDLANGLGNLISRVAKMIENNLNGELILDSSKCATATTAGVVYVDYHMAIEEFRLHDALGEIWKIVAKANKYIDDQKPWVQAKEDQEGFLRTITTTVSMVHDIAWLLQPFMPRTADKIFETFGDKNRETIDENYKFILKKSEPLFPRLK